MLRGKLAVAAEREALFMEDSGAVVAACQLTVFATDAVRGEQEFHEHNKFGKKGRARG